MIAIILFRIGLFLAYDISQYLDHQDTSGEKGDNFVQVILINLTEIALVITVTQSLKWSLTTYQTYDKSKEERMNSSIDQD